MKEEVSLVTLTSVAMILITIGVDLVKELQYLYGILSIALGIVLLLIYFLYVEKKYILRLISK